LATVADRHVPRKGSFRLLTAGFGALLVLMVALAGISIFTLQRHQAQLDKVVGERMTKVSLALTMRKASRERTLSLLRLLLLDDPFDRDEEWMAFNGYGAEFAQARLSLLASPLSDAERSLLEEQGALTGKAIMVQLQVIDLINAGQIEPASRLLSQAAIPSQQAVIAKVDAFDQLQRQAADQARFQASVQLDHARTLILLLGGSALVIGLAIAVMVTRTVRERGAHDAYLATHDPLTGLPNRTLLMDRLHHAINRAERQQSLAGLLFIDLDRFKVINDSYGHAAGDQVLLTVSERVSQQLRKSDTLARLSGDEFVALLEELPTTESVELTAQRIVDSCALPVMVGALEIPISVSVGIALYPRHGRTRDELLSHGDTAMYRSKQHGRNRWHVYEGGAGS